MELELALTWTNIQGATKVAGTCISPVGGSNHDRARQDWEDLPGMVEYWLPKWDRGYCRVIRLTSHWIKEPLWLLDYLTPVSIRYLDALAEALTGALLVSKSSLTSNYKPPGLLGRVFLPTMNKPGGVLHMQRSLDEQQWLLIQCQGKAETSARASKELQTQPIYDD